MNDRQIQDARPRPSSFATFATCGMMALIFVSPSWAADPALPPICWRSGSARQAVGPNGGSPAAALRHMMTPGVVSRHVIVQFDAPISTGVRQKARSAGIELLAPLGANSYFARVDAGRLSDSKVSALASLRAAAPIGRAQKLHPLLANGRAPSHAVIGRFAEGHDDPADVVAVYCLFHRDVGINDAIALAAGQGANIRGTLRSINALVLEMPRNKFALLADEDAVQWIEPALPQLGPNNAENRALTQVNDLQAAPYDLNGSGVNVLVYDGNVAWTAHPDFGGRAFQRDWGISDHSTHVAGTIGGAGTVSGGLQRGMAPGVTMQCFGTDYSDVGIGLYDNPGDIEASYDAAINVLGVQIANNSVGTNVEANGFDCALQGDYSVTDALTDAIVSGSLGRPFPVVWAAGNERQGESCNVEGFGGYYSIAPPSVAKNHITVGAVNADDDSMAWFSGWGPTDDGRLRPDVCGPGCQITGDLGVTSTGYSSTYLTGCGTSFAAPTITGICALIMQDYRAQFPSLTDPLNSTLKILLAHNAVDRGNVGPDYQFGYGSVRAKDTIDFMRTGNFAESSVDQSGVVRYWVPVDSGVSSLKITLAWDDVPGTPNVNPALVNDLDLVVVDPSSNQHYPWTLDPMNPSEPAVQMVADHLNNVEQVQVDSPDAGLWLVEVRGFNVPEGPQDFSICATPRLVTSPLVITYPNALPDYIDSGNPTSFDVKIEGVGETLVGGTGLLHYRFDGGSFQTASLVSLVGDLYQATLPAANCAGQPQFYVSAVGSGGSTVTEPANAPTGFHTAVMGALTTPFADNFETDQGWTVSGSISDPNAGQWQRGIPANGHRGDPGADADGGGQCWLTGNIAGNSDVDDGGTILTSPIIDFSSGATLTYRYWLNDIVTGAMGPEDSMTVEIATNAGGTNWQTLRTYSTAAPSWRSDSIAVGTETAATVTVRIRFTVTDNAPGDVIEGGIDAVVATTLDCQDALLGDLNGDGFVNDADLPLFTEVLMGELIVDSDVANSSLADMNGDGLIDGRDIQFFLTAIIE